MLKLLVRVLEKLPNELMHTNIIEILFCIKKYFQIWLFFNYSYIEVVFSYEIFCKIPTVTVLLVCDKYCPIID